MGQKQLDAIKERVNNIGDNFQWVAVDSEEVNMAKVETKGLGGYTVGIEMAIEHAEFIANARQDVPALLAEVERLQKRLAQTEECYEIMEKAAFKASDKLKSFREALEFYADKNSHFRVDMYAESTVLQDKGEIARQALGGESDD